jgi:hypothetical protein
MIRVVRHANMQARVRARLGDLPGRELWRELAEVRRLDALLERLRASTLAFWVRDLPRHPEPPAIERQLAQQWHARQRETARLLPETWKSFRRWLELGAALSLLPVALAGAGDASVARHGEAAGHARFLDGTRVRWRAWRQEGRGMLRDLRGVPADTARRLERLWLAHEQTIVQRRAVVSDVGVDPDAQWFLRAQLERGLHDLAAGDPFHPALVPILLGLEWIQFERARALLLARAYGWPAPRFFPG